MGEPVSPPPGSEPDAGPDAGPDAEADAEPNPDLEPELPAATVARLAALTDRFVASLLRLTPHSPELSARTDDVRRLGARDIQAGAVPDSPFGGAGVQPTGAALPEPVGAAMDGLRRTMEDLDPQLLRPRGRLRRTPAAEEVTGYFERFQDVQGRLESLLYALRAGQDALAKDNIALAAEKRRLLEVVTKLREHVCTADLLDARLSAAIGEMESADPARAASLRGEVVFAVRQRRQDLLTQLSVSMQAALALDLAVAGNVDLARGVDRASVATVAALRSSLLVARGLGLQRTLLERIAALASTTAAVVEGESVRAADGPVRPLTLHDGLVELRAAFDDAYAAMAEVDAFTTGQTTRVEGGLPQLP